MDNGVFGPEDCATPENLKSKLGQPGEFPFTRGVQRDMYRGRLWTMRQYAGFGTAEESNKRYKLLLEKGQTGISVAFDLPTQMGFDSDDSMALGEVGKVGVSIASLEDMEILFKGIRLDKISTSMTINATAGVLLAFYINVARKQGVAMADLKGTIQNDILKEYIARGTYIYPPGPSMRLITDIFSYCKDNLPNWNTISISGYHIREAGSTAAQEVAFTLADGIAYVKAAREAGLDIDSFAPRLSFFFNVHNNFLEEVAKFRAARRVWAHIMRDKFGAKNPKSWALKFHTQTAGCSLTAQQPDNNVVRVALQAMAAVLGGTQSLHTNSKDEALGLPTEESATLALRTQQIIAHESGVAKVVDPLGGSYYVEHQTDLIEAEVYKYFEKIDSMGGMVKCIETGFIQKEIQNSSFDFQKHVEEKKEIIVGVNDFVIKNEKSPTKILKVVPALEKKQVSRLKKYKKKRSAKEVEAQIQRIQNAARTGGNLMELFVEATSKGCTLGEISHGLRQVFGVHKEHVVI